MDPADLLAEEQRQFDGCYGCRLCWNLCPAFPALFDATDAVDGDLCKVGRPERDSIEDLCFQCKLCWVACPYTERRDYDLGVPWLIERSKFVKARETCC